MFHKMTTVIGSLKEDGTIMMMGTAFLIQKNGMYVTSSHVLGINHKNLVMLIPKINEFNQYQDTSDKSCNFVKAEIIEIDPIRDLAILKTDLNFDGIIPAFTSLDNTLVGEDLSAFGYPHCTEGRHVFTYQKTSVGAKILLENKGIKSKHAVLNIQSRPGQSGSMIFCDRLHQIVGVLIGTYAPNTGISLAGINPAELNQTTQVISIEYIRDML